MCFPRRAPYSHSTIIDYSIYRYSHNMSEYTKKDRNLDNRGSIFLRNVRKHLPHYTSHIPEESDLHELREFKHMPDGDSVQEKVKLTAQRIVSWEAANSPLGKRDSALYLILGSQESAIRPHAESLGSTSHPHALVSCMFLFFCDTLAVNTKKYFKIIYLFTLFYLITATCFGSGCRDRAVGIATGYGLDDERIGVRVPRGSRILPSPRRPERL
jgi:hypothetical protein